MELVLTRTYLPEGTNGKLRYNGKFQCYTIELPWLNNEQKLSCIPEGRYRLIIRYSLKHGTHFMLKDVKERALILMHPANDAVKELQGCIAPVTKLTGQGKGIASRLAFEKLRQTVLDLTGDGPVFIIIKS